MSHSSATAVAHDEEENKFQIYIKISMLLSVITGIEIVVIFLPFAVWLIVTTLVVLSTVKFLYVIFYFMHLRWDKAFCTILFFIGMVLAGGTALAMHAIFSVGDSVPLSSISSAASTAASYFVA